MTTPSGGDVSQNRDANAALRENWELVVTVCRRHLSGRPMADIEDAIQATFEQFLRAKPSTIRDPAAWFVVVATRVCARSLREVYRQRDTALNPLDAKLLADPCDLVVEQRSIGELLAVLTPLEQEVLVLRYSRCFSYSDIGHRVGLSESNARQIAHRSRARLRDALTLIDPDV